MKESGPKIDSMEAVFFTVLMEGDTMGDSKMAKKRDMAFSILLTDLYTKEIGTTEKGKALELQPSRDTQS